MYGEVNEDDWILFRKRVGEWQQRIFRELVENYSFILSSPEQPSERFWKLRDTIERDLRISSLVLDIRRSKMDMNILTLLGDGVITLSDLEGFSDDVLEKARRYLQRCEISAGKKGKDREGKKEASED